MSDKLKKMLIIMFRMPTIGKNRFATYKSESIVGLKFSIEI